MWEKITWSAWWTDEYWSTRDTLLPLPGSILSSGRGSIDRDVGRADTRALARAAVREGGEGGERGARAMHDGAQ